MPTADLPGIGASMRTLVAASASARSSDKRRDVRNFHAAFGFELVARNRRTALDVHHLRADAETGQRIFEDVRAVRIVDDLRLRRVEKRKIRQDDRCGRRADSRPSVGGS